MICSCIICLQIDVHCNSYFANLYTYIIIHLFVNVDLHVGFQSATALSVHENSGIAQPLLVLSKPSAFIETVQVDSVVFLFVENLATGMVNLKFVCILSVY